LSGADLDLKKSAVKITYVDSYDTKSEYNITRTHSPKCKDVQLSVEMFGMGTLQMQMFQASVKKHLSQL